MNVEIEQSQEEHPRPDSQRADADPAKTQEWLDSVAA